jgi:hypothetical protein
MIFLFLAHLGLGCGAKEPQNLDPRYLKAEYKRLSQEMERHASRQRWAKADRVFGEIQSLNVVINYDDWILAAEVTQELGVIADTRTYLRNAYGLRSTQQVKDWKKLIEDQYGDVVLEVKSNDVFTFSPQFQTGDQAKRTAIKYAKSQLDDNRSFSGMLPVGVYHFVGEDFEVQSGLEIVRSLDPRQRKKGLKKAVIKDLDSLIEE